MNHDNRPIQSLKVLVFSRNPASSSQICTHVASRGHEVVVSSDPSEALSKLNEFSPNLVILEANTCERGDLELIKDLQKEPDSRWTPILLIAPAHGDHALLDSLKAESDDFLAFPFEASTFSAKLRFFAKVSRIQARFAEATRKPSISKNDNFPEAVITLNHLECVEDANIAACRLLCGDANGDLIGRSTIEVFGTNLAQLLSKRKLTLTAASGARFPAQVSLSEWVEDEQARYTLVVRDLTEQTEINRIKDEFLATVSHELRTPLASVLGALGLLSAGATGALPESARMLTDVAYRNGQRLSRLVDDILDLTKLESDRLVLMERPVNLVELVTEAISANESVAQNAKVSLALESCALDAAEAEVRLDPDRFIQIMTNLLSNAIKHSSSGQTVHIATRLNEQRMVVSVKDSGPGIEANFRARVFEKFSQADASDRRAQGGMGLGLYITRMLVQRMGGRVFVDSSPGQGAEFRVEFPLNSSLKEKTKTKIIHVDFDLDARLRVARWLEGKAELVSVVSVAQARAQGLDFSRRVVIANPRGQGKVSDFYSDLRSLAEDQNIFIYSDSVEKSSAIIQNYNWLSVADTSKDDFIHTVMLHADAGPRKALA
jgi:signal transduction histidine kinase